MPTEQTVTGAEAVEARQTPEAAVQPTAADISRLLRREQILFFLLGSILAVPLNVLATFLYVLLDSACR
ncbi:hypothetical protein ACTFTM_16640 [Micromonospora sp. RB23]